MIRYLNSHHLHLRWAMIPRISCPSEIGCALNCASLPWLLIQTVQWLEHHARHQARAHPNTTHGVRPRPNGNTNDNGCLRTPSNNKRQRLTPVCAPTPEPLSDFDRNDFDCKRARFPTLRSSFLRRDRVGAVPRLTTCVTHGIPSRKAMLHKPMTIVRRLRQFCSRVSDLSTKPVIIVSTCTI